MVLRAYVAIVDQTVGLQAWPSRQNCCRPSAYYGHSQHDWTASKIMKMSHSSESLYEAQVIRKSVQIHASSVAIVVQCIRSVAGSRTGILFGSTGNLQW